MDNGNLILTCRVQYGLLGETMNAKYLPMLLRIC